MHVSSSRLPLEGRRQSETWGHLGADERSHLEVGLSLKKTPAFS